MEGHETERPLGRPIDVMRGEGLAEVELSFEAAQALP